MPSSVAPSRATSPPLLATADTQLDRLKIACGAGTDTALGIALGISQASVAKAKKKKKVPSDWIIAISNKFGISADWLIHGTGSMYNQDRITVERARAGTLRAGKPIAEGVVKSGPPQDAPGADAQQARRGDPLDADLLETVIEVVEEVLEESGRELAPDKKAKLIVAIYDLYQDSEREVDKSSVLRLVKSVA